MASGKIQRHGMGAWQNIALPHTLAKDSVVRIRLNPTGTETAHILVADGSTYGIRINAFSGYAEICDFVCRKGSTLTVTAQANGNAAVYISPIDF